MYSDRIRRVRRVAVLLAPSWYPAGWDGGRDLNSSQLSQFIDKKNRSQTFAFQLQPAPLPHEGVDHAVVDAARARLCFRSLLRAINRGVAPAADPRFTPETSQRPHPEYELCCFGRA